jgi:hypothetical protein
MLPPEGGTLGCRNAERRSKGGNPTSQRQKGEDLAFFIVAGLISLNVVPET